MELALFDFDGTITDREMYVPYLEQAVPPLRLAIGKVLLAPLGIGYKLGWVPANLVRAAVIRFGLSGLSLARLQASGVAFAEQVLPATIRPEALERLRWHQARGDTVVVVSGALEVALAHWCAQHRVELLASCLEIRGGIATGRYAGAQCVGEEKVRRVRERFNLSHFATIHAYGDTPEDEAMLALAHRRWYRGVERKADVESAATALDEAA
ncbi:HAD-IB family phosphatase [Lysobacter terrae]